MDNIYNINIVYVCPIAAQYYDIGCAMQYYNYNYNYITMQLGFWLNSLLLCTSETGMP